MPSVDTVLRDNGALVALFSEGQYAQEDCERALKDLGGTLLTTLPVITEAFYFLDSRSEREGLWKFVLGGALRLAEILPDDLGRMLRLMEKYSDLPMDFADASLVALSESLNVRKIFTLDQRHFRVYRPRHAHSFEVFP